nr:tyrosine-protein phosphatase [Microbacterium ginsengiterrae]
MYNYRDTGGLPLRGGGSSRAGVLYRSEALGALTDEGVGQFADTLIGTVVDFRTPAERETAPDRLPDSRPFDVVELSILQGATGDLIKTFTAPGAAPTPAQLEAAMDRIPELGDMYVEMLRGGAAAFARVAKLIAASHDDAPTGVIVHCTAGKDRTGVATALMLDAAGVDRDAVIGDYAQSEANLAGPWADGMIHMIESFGVPVTPKLRTLATGTPPAAIEQALSWTDAAGGAGAYLLSGGLTSAELDRLGERIAG